MESKKLIVEEKECFLNIYIDTVYPQKEIKINKTDYVILVYVMEGRGEHSYDGKLYPIAKGNVFIVESNVEHGYRAFDGNVFKLHTVKFHPGIIKDSLEELSKITSFVQFFYAEPFFRKESKSCSKLLLAPNEQIELTLLLEQVYEELKHKSLGYELMIQSKLKSILIFLSRCYNSVGTRKMDWAIDEGNFINRVCQFIKRYHAKQLDLQQISEMCGMSISTFTSKFKASTGLTFIEYRNKIRIDIAKDLLETTNLKVISISSEVGFEDLSNFNKTFKKIVGISPAQYRKQARRNFAKVIDYSTNYVETLIDNW